MARPDNLLPAMKQTTVLLAKELQGILLMG